MVHDFASHRKNNLYVLLKGFGQTVLPKSTMAQRPSFYLPRRSLHAVNMHTIAVHPPREFEPRLEFELSIRLPSLPTQWRDSG